MLLQQSTEPRIVWEPLPGSQALAVDSRCNITLFTGTRGPGKTDAQIMKFRRRVGMGYGPFWRGIIFDREYKHLDDLVSKTKRWFNAFGDGAEWKSATSAYKWVWPTGEELLIRSIKDVEEYENYHGQEYPFEGWNEITKYPTSACFDRMMSCNRSSFTPEKDSPRDRNGKITKLLPPIPLEVFATCNSNGAGHAWVKEKFIDVAPYGTIVRTTIEVFNPQSQRQENVTRTQVTIFGSYRENKYLDPVYIAGLEEATKNNDNLHRSWLLGDWDIVAGGAFDDLWNKNVHIKPRFKVPSSWHLDRSFDWGSTKPFSTGWWAEANGEEAKLLQCKICGLREEYHPVALPAVHEFDALMFCPPKGSLIQFGEWYGTKKIHSDIGLKMSAGDVAVGIKAFETQFIESGWIENKPWAGPADNQIRDVKESDVDTIEKKMADKGIRWESSDKSPGSRRNGMELFRTRLLNATRGEGPGIYFMDNCRASIATIPILPRDEDHPDDVDSETEDHPWDMVRYRVLKGSRRLAKKLKVSHPN